MTFVLALESSTSAAKAAVYASDGRLLRLEQQNWPWTAVDLQDAPLMLETLLACGKKAAEGYAISAIGLSGIIPSMLLCKADMTPLSPIWTWAHTGSAATVAQYVQREEDTVNALYRRTGCPAHAQYPLWQLLHRRLGGENIAAADVVTTQLGYVFARLTGQFISSRSIESASALLNLNARDWDDGALALAGITRAQLPPLAECDESRPLLPAMAQALGVPAGIPVSVGGPDGILNQVGSGAMAPGSMTFSIGTSGAIRIVCPTPGVSGGRNTWCYYIRDCYLAGASTSGAGSCVAWFRRSFAPGVPFETLESEAEAAGSADIPIYLPFNFGERAPGFCASRLGGFCGLNGSHGRGHMYRAVLEGVMFNMYHCYELLTAKTGRPEKIFLSGGVTNSPLWMHLAAEVFGREMLLHEGEHASLNGAAALALKCCGELADIAAYRPQIIGAIQPTGEGRDVLMARYAQYLDYYRRTEPAPEAQ